MKNSISNQHSFGYVSVGWQFADVPPYYLVANSLYDNTLFMSFAIGVGVDLPSP